MLGWLARRAPRNQRGIALRRFIGNRVIRMRVDPRAVPPQGVHQQQLSRQGVGRNLRPAELRDAIFQRGAHIRRCCDIALHPQSFSFCRPLAS